MSICRRDGLLERGREGGREERKEAGGGVEGKRKGKGRAEWMGMRKEKVGGNGKMVRDKERVGG
jgi:hypothetical protein